MDYISSDHRKGRKQYLSCSPCRRNRTHGYTIRPPYPNHHRHHYDLPFKKGLKLHRKRSLLYVGNLLYSPSTPAYYGTPYEESKPYNYVSFQWLNFGHNERPTCEGRVPEHRPNGRGNRNPYGRNRPSVLPIRTYLDAQLQGRKALTHYGYPDRRHLQQAPRTARRRPPTALHPEHPIHKHQGLPPSGRGRRARSSQGQPALPRHYLSVQRAIPPSHYRWLPNQP